jgi:flagellar biosynthesis protein FlhF
MKIKRFEASSMSDALRMVKKEFGDDAVILSAKTVRKSNHLFGGKRKQMVVVTAAIDRTVHSTGGVAPSGMRHVENLAGKCLDSEGFGTESRTGSIHDISPITRTGQKKLRSKFYQYAQESCRDESREAESIKEFYSHLLEQGVAPAIARDWDSQASQLVSAEGEDDGETAIHDALSQVIAAQGVVSTPQFSGTGAGETQRVMVLVGGSGVGKTTTAAKLAAVAKMQSQPAAVISLDNYRIAGTVELERYAKIIGFRLETAHDGGELSEILERLRDVALIIVDTPGMALTDTPIRACIEDMIKAIPHPEIHLLLSAAWHDRVLTNAVEFFRPLGVNRLLFTQLDWVAGWGHLANTAVRSGLPISYWTDCAHVPEGIQSATANRLADMLYPQSKPNTAEMPITVVASPKDTSSGPAFLANRNSDIFHRSACRAVHRINNENIVRFKNESEAMAQMFKPCRMCCADLSVPKPLYELARRSIARSR